MVGRLGFGIGLLVLEPFGTNDRRLQHASVLRAILIALVASANPRTRALARLAVATFLVVHGVMERRG